jgi:hypothetical protein
MTKRTRTLLFFLCVFGFLLVTPLVILYGQGYRFDFKNRVLTQTGAFYVKALPKSAEVFVDGQLKSKTDFLFGSALVENLLPGTFLLEVKKEGFFPWQKRLPVLPKAVTEAKNIVLFPEKPVWETLAQGVEDFYPSPDAKKALLLKRDAKGWYFTLLNLESGLEESFLKEADFAKKGRGQFLSADWSADSQKILLRTAVAEKPGLFVKNLSQSGLNQLAFLNADQIDKVVFDPRDSRQLLALENQTFYSVSLVSKKSEKMAENVLAFAAGPEGYWLLNSQGLILNNNSILATIKIKPETFYEISVFQDQVFLRENEAVYWLDPASKEIVQIDDEINDFTLSPDRQKLAFWRRDQIWLFFFREELGQPKRLDREKFLLSQLASGENLGRVFWLNNHYLVFSDQRSINAVEIDQRDQPNLTRLENGLEKPGLFFSRENKKALLFLSQGDLKSATAGFEAFF